MGEREERRLGRFIANWNTICALKTAFGDRTPPSPEEKRKEKKRKEAKRNSREGKM